MTFYSRGSPVNWNGGSKSGEGGKGRVPLGKKVFLGKRVAF